MFSLVWGFPFVFSVYWRLTAGQCSTLTVPLSPCPNFYWRSYLFIDLQELCIRLTQICSFDEVKLFCFYFCFVSVSYLRRFQPAPDHEDLVLLGGFQLRFLQLIKSVVHSEPGGVRFFV